MIPALGRLKQEAQEFKASLGYSISPSHKQATNGTHIGTEGWPGDIRSDIFFKKTGLEASTTIPWILDFQLLELEFL